MAGTMTGSESEDRRVRRTRLAIFDAFRTLVLARKYDDIRVADLIGAADIGRSTFYEHFKSKDDVLLTSIEPLFAPLAAIPAGDADRRTLQFVLEHFWEQRRFGRVIMRDALLEKLTRKLADMIEARLGGDGGPERRLAAIARAASMLGVIRAWLAGEFSMTAQDLAVRLAEGAG